MVTCITRITRKPHMSIIIHWEIDGFAYRALWLKPFFPRLFLCGAFFALANGHKLLRFVKDVFKFQSTIFKQRTLGTARQLLVCVMLHDLNLYEPGQHARQIWIWFAKMLEVYGNQYWIIWSNFAKLHKKEHLLWLKWLLHSAFLAAFCSAILPEIIP